MKGYAIGLLLGWPGICFAQASSVAPRFVVSGQTLSNNNQPLPGVTVQLLRLSASTSDTTAVTGAQTDGQGNYQLITDKPGQYLLRLSTIGMKSVQVPPFALTQTDSSQRLPPIRLEEDTKLLREVAVVGQKQALEVSEGKLVVNIEHKLAASGSSAFELLQRTPGISVTQDDNILLKGNANVNVMLDGKMTYLSAQQLANLLRSLPAENLTRIELITAPSSQYDAAGNAGIINIVTKKSSQRGYALNLSAGAGTGHNPQTTENLVGNIKTKAVNLYGNYGYSYKRSYLSRTSYRVIPNVATSTVYDRASFDPSVSRNHTYKLGMDIELTKQQEIGFVYSGYSNLWSRQGNGPTRINSLGSENYTVVQNHNLTQEPSVSNAFNGHYKIVLDTAGRQLSVDADYAHYRNNSSGSLGNQLFSQTGAPLQPYQELAFSQPNQITIRSVKMDGILPIHKTKLTAGLKYAYVTANNNFVYDSLINNQYVFSSLLSNQFVYQERVYAAYASANRQLGKTSLDAGLRVEKTHSEGNSVNLGRLTIRDYTNWFPYLSLSRSFNPDHAVSFSLTRRINRPVYANLNPSRYFLDKFSYLEGNPFLLPETSWNGAVSYTYKSAYMLTLSASRTMNSIAEFAQQNPQTGELIISMYNFARKDYADVLLVFPITIAPFWTVQTTLNGRYLHVNFNRGAIIFSPHKFTVEATLTNSLKLPWGCMGEITAQYTSPSLGGVYVLRSYFSVDGGFKKTLVAKKLDARISFTDLFNTIHYWGYSIYSGANVSYNHRGDNRRVNLSLVYKLGGQLNTGQDRKLDELKRIN